MAVRIRLARTGRTNRPFYRFGAFDSRTRRDGSGMPLHRRGGALREMPCPAAVGIGCAAAVAGSREPVSGDQNVITICATSHDT